MMNMGRPVTIWHTTCGSHTGNLLAKDLINEEVKSLAMKIVREFKNPDIEALLLQKGGT